MLRTRRSLADVLGRATPRQALRILQAAIVTRTLAACGMNQLHVARINDVLMRQGRGVSLHHTVALRKLGVVHHGKRHLVLLFPLFHVGAGRRFSLGILALDP